MIRVRAPRLRRVEWVLIVYFTYVLVVATFSPFRDVALMRAALLLLGVATIFASLAWGEYFTRRRALSISRDWFALAFTIAAYREMDLFTPLQHTHRLERVWVIWDRMLLNDMGLRAAIESLGRLLPFTLELCYLLVYAAAPFSLALVYAKRKRERSHDLLLCYVLATLLSYTLFPYFPSEPPRTIFPGDSLPAATAVRQWNLWLLGGYGIHSSVFPSAHVSSAFGSAFGLLYVMPEAKRWGFGLLGYACALAVATVYGRYHYSVDAVAGVAVAFIAMSGVTIWDTVARNKPRCAVGELSGTL